MKIRMKLELLKIFTFEFDLDTYKGKNDEETIDSDSADSGNTGDGSVQS